MTTEQARRLIRGVLECPDSNAKKVDAIVEIIMQAVDEETVACIRLAESHECRGGKRQGGKYLAIWDHERRTIH